MKQKDVQRGMRSSRVRSTWGDDDEEIRSIPEEGGGTDLQEMGLRHGICGVDADKTC